MSVGLPTYIDMWNLYIRVTMTQGLQARSTDTTASVLDRIDIANYLSRLGYDSTKASANSYCNILHRRTRIRVTNPNNVIAHCTLYTLCPRLDLNVNQGPGAYWVSGLKQQDNAGSTDYSLNSFVTPFDSKYFTKMWKVMKKRRFDVKPGQEKNYLFSSKKPKRFCYNRSADQFGASANGYYYKGLTIVYYLVLEGQSTSLTGVATFSTATVPIIYSNSTSIKYSGYPVTDNDTFNITEGAGATAGAFLTVQENNPEYSTGGTTDWSVRSV